ncbi:MAG: ABC transporter substrate-binding protein [Bacillota bacterium]
MEPLSNGVRTTSSISRPLGVLVIVIILLGGSSLCFCGGGNIEPPEAEPDIRATVAIPTDIRGWDPHAHSSSVTESVLCNIYDYLIWKSPEGELEPALATSWERLDSKRWRLTLRDDVSWHDGAPFDSDDVVFTLKRLAAIGTREITPQYPHFRSIREVIPVEDFVVDIVTEYPDPAVPYRLSRKGSAIIPAHLFEGLRQETSEEDPWEAFFDNPIGTGPYRPVTRIPDERIRLTSSPNYWRGPAAVTDITFFVVPDSSDRSDLLTRNEVDIATNIGPNDWRDLQLSEMARLVRRVTPKVLVLNPRLEPEYGTADAVIREAIELSIDAQYLVDDILAGAATPTRTRVTPASPGYHPDLYNSNIYNPAAAREMLEGYDSKDLSLQLLVPEHIHPELPQLAGAIARMMEEVGFEMTVDVKPWGEYLSQISEGNHPALYLSIETGSAHDCSLSFELLAADDNYVHPTGFRDSSFNESLREATAESNRQRRTRLFWDLAEYLARVRPNIPLLHLLSNHGVSTAIDWTPRTDELLWMWPTVRKSAPSNNH